MFVAKTLCKDRLEYQVSNFLKEPPPNIHTETIKQSAIEDYDAVYNND
jgi:hypothetical protein